MIALSRGNGECVRLLVSAGARLDVRDEVGATPLLVAAQRGIPEYVRLLLENDADPRVVNQGGSSALMMSAQCGHLECTELLLAADSSVINFRNQDGDSAFMLAVKNFRTDCAEALLLAGAEIGSCAENGATLVIAAQRQHVLCVEGLINGGAFLQTKSKLAIRLS
eukprot:m.482546 g.482546  ORF g.482546 m.482546 type:complete len:166 (-) comp57189_c1_seq17:1447-1944(-)